MFLSEKIRLAFTAMEKIAMLTLMLLAAPAHALPSYARQTGMECVACHIGGFGPQLTPTGIMFKLTGYTDTDGQPGKVPLSAMILASRTRTSADQIPAPDHLEQNNNVLLDQASIFLAGRLTENLGSFIQVTHNGVNHSNILDQVDVRYAHAGELAGRDALFGISINNNPSVQDPFNTLAAWKFPYVSSPAGFGAGDAILLDGGLTGRVIGASAYTLLDKSVYAEIASYRSMTPSFQHRIGLSDDQQRLGANAYWRLAWFQDKKNQDFHLGVFGWNALLESDQTMSVPRDKYRDVGIDGSYQFLGTRQHIVTANASYATEKRTDGVSAALARLNESRLNASYYFQQTWGGTVGLFSTHGSNSMIDRRGRLLQIDWTPWGKENASAPSPFGWANLRLGAQYWAYNKFNGDTVSASNANTLYLFAWMSF